MSRDGWEAPLRTGESDPCMHECVHNRCPFLKAMLLELSSCVAQGCMDSCCVSYVVL